MMRPISLALAGFLMTAGATCAEDLENLAPDELVCPRVVTIQEELSFPIAFKKQPGVKVSKISATASGAENKMVKVADVVVAVDLVTNRLCYAVTGPDGIKISMQKPVCADILSKDALTELRGTFEVEFPKDVKKFGEMSGGRRNINFDAKSFVDIFWKRRLQCVVSQPS
jgi:hypothetical protein